MCAESDKIEFVNDERQTKLYFTRKLIPVVFKASNFACLVWANSYGIKFEVVNLVASNAAVRFKHTYKRFGLDESRAHQDDDHFTQSGTTPNEEWCFLCGFSHAHSNESRFIRSVSCPHTQINTVQIISIGYLKTWISPLQLADLSKVRFLFTPFFSVAQISTTITITKIQNERRKRAAKCAEKKHKNVWICLCWSDVFFLKKILYIETVEK